MSNVLKREEFEKFIDIAYEENEKVWNKPEKHIEGFKGQIDARNCKFVGRSAFKAALIKFLELMGENSYDGSSQKD